MARYVTDTVYRLWMFFLVPLALVHLAFPGRDPLKRKAKVAQSGKPNLAPVYFGPELGNKPYKAEVGPKRHASHRQHGLAR